MMRWWLVTGEARASPIPYLEATNSAKRSSGEGSDGGDASSEVGNGNGAPNIVAELDFECEKAKFYRRTIVALWFPSGHRIETG